MARFRGRVVSSCKLIWAYQPDDTRWRIFAHFLARRSALQRTRRASSLVHCPLSAQLSTFHGPNMCERAEGFVSTRKHILRHIPLTSKFPIAYGGFKTLHYPADLSYETICGCWCAPMRHPAMLLGRLDEKGIITGPIHANRRFSSRSSLGGVNRFSTRVALEFEPHHSSCTSSSAYRLHVSSQLR